LLLRRGLDGFLTLLQVRLRLLSGLFQVLLFLGGMLGIDRLTALRTDRLLGSGGESLLPFHGLLVLILRDRSSLIRLGLAQGGLGLLRDRRRLGFTQPLEIRRGTGGVRRRRAFIGGSLAVRGA